LAGDSAAVSEVIGFLLTFGILSVMLVMSMYAFGVAAKGAQTQAVELHAESAATRVAGVVVEAAVLVEQQGTTSPTLAYVLDLPDDLEGRSYLVRLEAASGSEPDLVRVLVPSLGIDVTAPVFAAAAPANVAICTTEVGGGSLTVLYDAPAADDADLPGDVASCGGGPADKFIFIGEGP
jgi:hypothetical protein